MSTTETSDITACQLKDIREAAGLSQSKFWAAIGVKQPSGSEYESGQRMPEPVRRLVHLHYVAGIPTDACADDLARIGAMAQAGGKARRALRRAEALLASATGQVQQAAAQVGGNE